MRIGIGLPFLDGDGDVHDYQSLATCARWIEEAGFNGIWMGDASFRGLATWPDPFLWLLAAAAATQRVELGTAIYQIPLRNPVATAQRMLTIHGLSGGRFSAGVGPGSNERGFAAVGKPFEERNRIFREYMTTIRELCDGKAVGDADLAPWPEIVGGPRFLLGAWHGSTMLRTAATAYDGWLSSAGRTTVKTMVDAIKRYRDEGGKRAIVASCSADLGAEGVSMSDDDPFNLRCSPAEAADRLAWVAELGYDDILINIRDSSRERQFDSALRQDRLLELRSIFEPAPEPIGALVHG